MPPLVIVVKSGAAGRSVFRFCLIILIQYLRIHTVKFFSRKKSQQLPSKIQSLFHASVLVHALSDITCLKFFSELQIFLVDRRQFVLTDNGCKVSCVSYFCVSGEQLVRQILMILSRMTGLSGSGKSSLAFDTIYAEGQRRYMESLSSYARQFLGQMEKPDVESIEGLPPAISIDQKSTNRNPRSTVGTVTEIYDYFRLLYARIGIPHCPKCGRAIEKQTIDQMVDAVMKLPERTRIQILAPVVRGRKGHPSHGSAVSA